MNCRAFKILVPLIVGLGAGQLACSGRGEPNASTTSSGLRAATARPRMRQAKPLAGHNPLLGQGGDPGDDQTAISLDPTLSALCQSFIGQVGVYKRPAPNVDAIVGDTIVTVGSQTGCSAAQNETTIAVDPHDFRHIVVGANDYRPFSAREARNDSNGLAYATFDGGYSWQNVQLPHLTFASDATGALSDMDAAGDPAVAFGPDGTVYYANLVFSRLNAGSGIAVSASHDGGVTWGDPSIVHTDGVDASGNPQPTTIFNDKEAIAVDSQSGRVYVTWTQFGATDHPIVVASSDDGGNTWTQPLQVNPEFTPGGITTFSSGSSPQVGRDGKLFIAYEAAVCATLACNLPTDFDAVVVSTSTDGGQTFASTVASTNFDFPFNNDTGQPGLTGENFRVNSFPQLALDQDMGKLYVTWADDRNGQYDANGNSVKTNGDAFVAASFDGSNWTAPVKLGTTADEVFPAIAARDHKVVVSVYTRTYDANGIGLDYASVSANGLKRLAKRPIRRLTSETSNPQIQFVSVGAVTQSILQGVFIGDYTSIALGGESFHPAWTDFRGRPGVTSPNQEVYTQSVQFDDFGPDEDSLP